MVACCSTGRRITSGRRLKTIVKAKVGLLLSYDYAKSGKRQKTIVKANIFETTVVVKELAPYRKAEQIQYGIIVSQLILAKLLCIGE